VYDTVNSTIGQGYMLVNPLQQAVVASRIASGKLLMPRLMMDAAAKPIAPLGIPQEHLDIIHSAMNEVVNGRGTAHAAAIPIPGVQLAGKTGTAQVVGLNFGNGKGGMWRHRDHGHFICFAPFDKPRYACAVLVQHGGGSGAAYPIARDVMTYLFDQQKAWDVLKPMEADWGGTPQERMAARFREYERKYGVAAPKVGDSEAEVASQNDPAPPPQPMQSAAASPAPEPMATPAAPAPALTPTGGAAQ
jgi:penicillin-binding protein 2